jgi:hypothetical protein
MMAKKELRVSFKNAPAAIQKQLFGEAKHAKIIIDSLTHFAGEAHEQEIFHYLNTDNDGDFVVGPDGTVSVTMVNLRKQLATMVATGQIKRFGGERSARYALIDFEGSPEPEDEDEEGEEEAA